MDNTKQISGNGSYETHRVDLVREITARTNNTSLKDEDFLNCVLEVTNNKNLKDSRQFIMKRAGSGQLNTPTLAGAVRGMFFWEDQQMLFYCVGTDVLVYNFLSGTTTTLASFFSTSTGEVGFTEYLYDTNQVVIVITDGTTLKQVTSTFTITTCADADLPTPHLPYPVFIDGYLFLAKAASADVYNSDLNDPMSWTAGNFLSAEMRADLVVRIALINNYLVVFGSESIEYFWDAGNVSGSPMQRNDTPIKLNTYINGFSQYGNDLYYIGENAFGQPAVYHLKDFKLDEISTNTIVRYLNQITTDSSTWKGNVVSCQGHAFYIVYVGTVSYVCDLDTGFWSRWSYKTLNNFPVIYSTRVLTSTTRESVFALDDGTGNIYFMSDSLYQDNSVNYTYRIVTDALDFDYMSIKTMARFTLIADRPNAISNYILYWTDDDYESYSNPRTVDLNQDLPSTYRLGWFRQRAFKIEYTDNFPLRIQKCEVDINKGNS